MATNKNTVKYVNFKGLKTKDESYEVGFNGIVTGTNIDISRNRKPYRRAGYDRVVTETIDSAWGDQNALIYTSGAALKFYDSRGAYTVRSDLTPKGHITAYKMGDSVYYSNGFQTGVFNYVSRVDRTFGLEVPTQISLTQSYGNLPAGRYMAAIVYVRGDGQIGGAGLAATIELSSEGGIVAAIPSSDDPTVVYVDLYLTTTNGTELYKANRVVNGSSEIVYRGNTYALQVPLRTDFRGAPPAFNEIEQFASRFLFGVDNMVVYSDPFAYEVVDMRSNFIPYTSKVVMIATVDSGFFVGTTSDVWFLSGKNVKEMSAVLIDSSGVVPHTKRYVKGDIIGRGESKDSMPFWVSKNGNICLGLPDGSMQSLTEKSVIIPEGVTGAAMFRQTNGQNHYIAVINT